MNSHGKLMPYPPFGTMQYPSSVNSDAKAQNLDYRPTLQNSQEMNTLRGLFPYLNTSSRHEFIWAMIMA